MKLSLGQLYKVKKKQRLGPAFSELTVIRREGSPLDRLVHHYTQEPRAGLYTTDPECPRRSTQ